MSDADKSPVSNKNGPMNGRYHLPRGELCDGTYCSEVSIGREVTLPRVTSAPSTPGCERRRPQSCCFTASFECTWAYPNILLLNLLWKGLYCGRPVNLKWDMIPEFIQSMLRNRFEVLFRKFISDCHSTIRLRLLLIVSIAMHPVNFLADQMRSDEDLECRLGYRSRS